MCTSYLYSSPTTSYSASTPSFVTQLDPGSHRSTKVSHSSSQPHLVPTYFVDLDDSYLHLYGSGSLEALDTPVQHSAKQQPVEKVHFHFIQFGNIAYWLTKLMDAYPHTTVSFCPSACLCFTNDVIFFVTFMHFVF